MARVSVDQARSRRQFLENYRVELTEWAPPVSVAFLVILIFLMAMLQYRMGYMGSAYVATRDNLTEALQNVSPTVVNDADDFAGEGEETLTPVETADMTQKMEEVHRINADTAGWISIDGTVIDVDYEEIIPDDGDDDETLK